MSRALLWGTTDPSEWDSGARIVGLAAAAAVLRQPLVRRPGNCFDNLFARLTAVPSRAAES